MVVEHSRAQCGIRLFMIGHTCMRSVRIDAFGNLMDPIGR